MDKNAPIPHISRTAQEVVKFKKHVSWHGLNVVVIAVHRSSCTLDDCLCNSHTADTSLEKVVGASTVQLVSIRVVIRLIFLMTS